MVDLPSTLSRIRGDLDVRVPRGSARASVRDASETCKGGHGRLVEAGAVKSVLPWSTSERRASITMSSRDGTTSKDALNPPTRTSVGAHLLRSPRRLPR